MFVFGDKNTKKVNAFTIFEKKYLAILLKKCRDVIYGVSTNRWMVFILITKICYSANTVMILSLTSQTPPFISKN